MTGDHTHGPKFDNFAGRENDSLPETGPSDAEPTDADLVASLLRGDQMSLRLLMDRYDRLIRFTIFRAGRRHCQRDPGWLDARANETWAGIVQSLRRAGASRIPPNLSAYLIQIARHKCHDATTAADARGVIPFEAALEAGVAECEEAGADADPVEVMSNLEWVEALHACVEHLSEDDKIIYSENALILDRKWKEAARRLGMAESTVRSRWAAVLDKLRRCVEKKIEKGSRPGR